MAGVLASSWSQRRFTCALRRACRRSTSRMRRSMRFSRKPPFRPYSWILTLFASAARAFVGFFGFFASSTTWHQLLL